MHTAVEPAQRPLSVFPVDLEGKLQALLSLGLCGVDTVAMIVSKAVASMHPDRECEQDGAYEQQAMEGSVP